jgi:hypothetical protein
VRSPGESGAARGSWTCGRERCTSWGGSVAATCIRPGGPADPLVVRHPLERREGGRDGRDGVGARGVRGEHGAVRASRDRSHRDARAGAAFERQPGEQARRRGPRTQWRARRERRRRRTATTRSGISRAAYCLSRKGGVIGRIRRPSLAGECSSAGAPPPHADASVETHGKRTFARYSAGDVGDEP